MVKPGGSTAKDKVNIPCNQAIPVHLTLGCAGRKLLRADKAVLLQLFQGQGSGKQGVLMSQQGAVFCLKMIPIHIQGNGLTGFFTGSCIIFDGQVAQGHVGCINHQRSRPEGTPLHAVLHDFCGGITENDFGLFRT